MGTSMEAQNPPSKIARIVHQGKTYRGFTFMQLQELEQQSLIYSYIEAGLPIPTYLILPIWKSFARSLIHQLYPNFLCYNPLYYDPKSSMDREPNRCRRTDGKKWRCTKNVVDGQKYCHRHLCRGRFRSRNHVQPLTTTATAPVSTAKETGSSENSSEFNLSASLWTTGNELEHMCTNE